MKFDPSMLLSQLSPGSNCDCFVVALSGGLDSMVLLHSLSTLKRNGAIDQTLRAIHVNHGINRRANHWQEICDSTCSELAIPLEVARLELGATSRANLEQRAREARYEIFMASLTAGECLVMAHHRDDQMETFLLRLMRGSGQKGLAGIPRTRELGSANLMRPLLSIDRNALFEFAISRSLTWVEDDSNECIDFDRNYLRHDVLPLLEKRWPGYRDSWEKSVQLSRESDELLIELARMDMSTVVTDDPRIIDLTHFVLLSEPRQRNLLRYWFDIIGFPGDDWQTLNRITREIITAGADSPACLTTSVGSVQRFRDQLFALASTNLFPGGLLSIETDHIAQKELPGNGVLHFQRSVNGSAQPPSAAGIRQEINEITVQYRLGGESMRLPGRPTKTLKKLLQEVDEPPWLRQRHPLLYYQGQLVCVPGIGVSDEFATRGQEPGYNITWEPPDLLYKPVL